MDREVDNTIRLNALRKVAFQPFSWVAASVLAAIGLITLLDVGPPYGYIPLASAVILAINLYLFEKHKKLVFASGVIVTIVGLTALYLYYSGSSDMIGGFWLTIFPIPAVMLLGRVIGAIAVTIYSIAFIPGLFMTSQLNLPYRSSYTFYVLLAVNVVTLLMFVYERILQHYLGSSQSHTERLNTAAESLKDEIAQREQVEYKMRIVLEDLANKNQSLDEIRRIDEATISSIGEAVMIVDKTGVITRANPSSGRILGINQEELSSRKISKLITFTDLDDKPIKEEDFVITQSLEHRSIIEETYKAKRSDGRDFYAVMTASPLVVGGTVFGAVVVVRDVTEEVNVDQAKTEFVSIASHQLRTPLSTINWYLEMVLNGDFGDINDEQREFITEAYDAGQRMGHLIDSLLNVSRIDVGVYAIDPQPTDLNKVIKDVLNDLDAKITEKKIDVEVSVSDEIGKPKFDARLINIIAENLISNAVKYTPEEGKVTVNVSGKDEITFTVSDTGFGIPAHQQDKIFTKMFRAENAVEHEPDGTGLGLYIIKSVIEEIGGSIAFESTEGEGTTFTAILPRDGMKPRKGSRELTQGAGV